MILQEIERVSPGHYFYDVNDQLKQHVYRRSKRLFAEGDAARDALQSREAVEARQKKIRDFFHASLGGLPPIETPLEARTVGVIDSPASAGGERGLGGEGSGFQVEKVIFQSRPRHYVTANLYLPDGLDGPRGAVLFLCGHHEQAKHQQEYQVVCQHLALAGLVVLAQDPIGQGERFSYFEPSLPVQTVNWGTYEHDYAGVQCLPLGDSLARYFLHDAMRGLDYLRSRPEVDGDRIGVTGNSGGGTQSSLMMLGDPRIAAAAPTTFIMSRETYMDCGGAQDAEQIWPGFTAQGFDHEDILLAIAPKPVRVLAVTSDFFPIEGTRRTVQRCRRVWGLYGREDHCDLVEDFSDHCYTPTLARAAARFFARHLLGRDVEVDSARTQAFEPKRLWCTASGQVRGEIADSESVQEATCERLTLLERERRSRPEAQRREEALQWLRGKVHSNRQPCDLNPRFYFHAQMEELAVEMCVWRSQEDLFNHARCFRDFRLADRKLPVSLAVWDEGSHSLHRHLKWIRRTCEAGRAAVVLDVSGVGPLTPRSITSTPPHAFYGMIHKMTIDLLWLEDDLASLRTFDVLRALDMIAAWPGLDAEDIQVYAHGRQGLYGRLAAALDRRIRKIEVVDGMESFAEWVGARHYDTYDIYSVVLHGALHHFDLPELVDG